MADLKEPKRKNRPIPEYRQSLPIPIESETGVPPHAAQWKWYMGYFMGDCVIVTDPNHMKELYAKGCFGKGTLSRSEPKFGKRQKGIPPIIRERQWQRRYESEQTTSILTEQSSKSSSGNDSTNTTVIASDNDKCEQGSLPIEENNENVDVEMVDQDSFQNQPSKIGSQSPTTEKCVADKITEDNADDITLSSSSNASSVNLQNDKNLLMIVDEMKEEKATEDKVEVSSAQLAEQTTGNNDAMEFNPDNESSSQCIDKGNSDDPGEASEKMDLDDYHPGKGSDENTVTASQTNKCPDLSEEICNNEEYKVLQTDGLNPSSEAEMNNIEEEVDRKSDVEIIEIIESESTQPVPEHVNVERSVLVVADSDSEDEADYFEKLKPRLELEKISYHETLNLTLEEAFFLSYALGCLRVCGLMGNLLPLIDLWKLCIMSKPDFIQKYVAYHSFRAKGWVVRSGQKFGGDFLLYKLGPQYYHASYIVIVDVLEGQGSNRRISGLSRKPLTMADVVALNRLAESTGKEVLFCNVMWPSNMLDKTQVTPSKLRSFKVSEVLLRRWKSSEERIDFEQEVCENVLEQEVCENVLEQEVGENVLEQEVCENVLEQEVCENVLEQEVGENVLEQEVGENVLEQEVGENVLEQEVGENVLEQKV